MTAVSKAHGLTIRKRPHDTLYDATGAIQDGTFRGRWHFQFDTYWDPEHVRFGNLRVFNDDTLSPGATWPLHPHTQNEVVTYVAAGEFRHEDEHGKGGVLRMGGIQHTTVGSGLFHAEINNRMDEPMRFIQIWFLPDQLDLRPSVEQREVPRAERTNRWLPLVSSAYPGTLPLRADGAVLASYLEGGHSIEHPVAPGHGLYFYVVEGGPVRLDGELLEAVDAAEVTGEGSFRVTAETAAELLLLEVDLEKGWPRGA